MKPAIMIICQTLSAVGFGANLVFAMIILTIPNGHQIVSELLSKPNPPVVQIMVMTAITGMATFALTFGNAENMTWKESYIENRKQISS